MRVAFDNSFLDMLSIQRLLVSTMEMRLYLAENKFVNHCCLHLNQKQETRVGYQPVFNSKYSQSGRNAIFLQRENQDRAVDRETNKQ